jgi:hypothetical protein
MGILKEQLGSYYDNTSTNYGAYRKLSLTEIVDSFNAMYVGEGKICEGVVINDIVYYAIRGLQELNYDTLRSEKDWELIVPSTLAIVLPADFINYTKIAWSDDAGVERLLYPAINSSNPLDITTLPLAGGDDEYGNPGDGFETGDDSSDLMSDINSDTLAAFQSQVITSLGSNSSDAIIDEYGDLYGGRFGLSPQHAQANGSFFIDEDQGKIHFSSNMSGKTLVLKYITDGLAERNNSIDLDASYVHKFAEEAIYKHILYGVLLARKNSSGGLLAEIKKQRFAETRKAKIRLSNYKIEELTQVMRGSSKIIKH